MPQPLSADHADTSPTSRTLQQSRRRDRGAVTREGRGAGCGRGFPFRVPSRPARRAGCAPPVAGCGVRAGRAGAASRIGGARPRGGAGRGARSRRPVEAGGRTGGRRIEALAAGAAGRDRRGLRLLRAGPVADRGAGVRSGRALAVAEAGDGAASGELSARVVGGHQGAGPIAPPAEARPDRRRLRRAIAPRRSAGCGRTRAPRSRLRPRASG